jgi:hypothetical protein
MRHDFEEKTFQCSERDLLFTSLRAAKTVMETNKKACVFNFYANPGHTYILSHNIGPRSILQKVIVTETDL